MNRQPIALAVLALCAAPAAAQNAEAPPQQIVVTGQAAATDAALREQRAADNIISVVRSDGIGRLPDKNAAEALQRLPGVSIERDQGEGRYVRIRGLGPDLNAVTINGSLVPSPERDRRAVMMDVLPSTLIRSLVVTKTLTPDQDANSLGGTVDVETMSAFDHRGRFLNIEAGLGHETNTGRNSPNGALAWSDRFMDGKLGIAAGLSYEERKFGSDNVETGGAWDGDALESFERRDYRITRERAGAAFNIEFKPQDGTQYFARGMFTRFSDDEVRQGHVIEFDEAQLAGQLGAAESARELKARQETQKIRSLVLGTDQRLGDWSLGLQFGTSSASEDTPQSIAGGSFEGAFDGVGFTGSKTPRLVGPAAINAADSFGLSEIELERTRAEDREHNLRLDLARAVELAGETVDLKFGGKASRRKKTSEQTTWTVEEFGGASTSLADYTGGSVDYPWGAFGPSISPSKLRGAYSDADLEIDEEESAFNDFTIHEDVDAAYFQAGADLAGWRVLGGLRYETTKQRTEGTVVDGDDFTPTKETHEHHAWLPGLHLRRELDADTSLRAAWTNSMVRPTFAQIAPGAMIDDDEAEFGNPALKPLRSHNLDIGIERRLGYAGAVSAYAFSKRIRDFVYQTDVAGAPGTPWETFGEAITFANGDDARVHGLELAYSQALRQLPAPWNGLVVGANATFTHSKATISRLDQDRSIPLPSQSDRVYNLMLGYETPLFGVRLAANYKSRYLLEVSDVLDKDGDLYVDAQTQLDLSARYNLSKQVQLVFEAMNLNDGPYYVYQGRSSRNAQYETYGRTYRLNLKVALY